MPAVNLLMPMYFFLLLIVSLGCGSLPPTDQPLEKILFATIGMVLAWSMLCHIAARITSNHVLSGHCDPHAGASVLERQLDVLRWMGLGVAVLCLAGFGLGRCLDAIPLIGQSMLLQSLVLLAPAMWITAATWSAEHHYGVRLHYADPGITGYTRAIGLGLRGGTTWLICPVLMLIAIADAVSHLPISETAINLIMAAIVIAGVVAGLPWVARYLFKRHAIDPTDAAWIQSLLESSGVQRTRVIGWDTGGRQFNAMVVGFIPPLRTLLISDRLLDEMPRDQLAMVVLHEAAHLRRRHVPLRMLSVLPAWVAASILSSVAGDAVWAVPVGTIAGILFTTLILKSVAYRTEHDADLFACRLAEKASRKIADVPSTESMAAQSLTRALRRVTAGHPAAAAPSWLHPGVDQRAEFMRLRTIDKPLSGDSANSDLAKSFG